MKLQVKDSYSKIKNSCRNIYSIYIILTELWLIFFFNKKVFIEVLTFEMSSWLRMGSGSEFQIVGAANENDFFNFADGIVRSLLEADLKLLDSL